MVEKTQNLKQFQSWKNNKTSRCPFAKNTFLCFFKNVLSEPIGSMGLVLYIYTVSTFKDLFFHGQL